MKFKKITIANLQKYYNVPEWDNDTLQESICGYCEGDTADFGNH